jgi:hypothetical protein
VASLDGDNLVALYKFNAFEIGSDKRSVFSWEWSYKRDRVFDPLSSFQQYFSYIVVVSFIGGGNQST